MNKFVLILISIGVMLSMSSNAQRLKVTDDGLDKVVLALVLDGPAMATLEMSRELELTEQQYQEVEELNQLRYEKLAEAEKEYAADPVLLSRNFRVISFESSELLKNILSEQQIKHLNELEASLNAWLLTEMEEE